MSVGCGCGRRLRRVRLGGVGRRRWPGRRGSLLRRSVVARSSFARGETLEPGRVRRAGAGRKRLTESDPGLLEALARLVEGDSRGDPERALRWTAKSLRNLAAELCAQGHQISPRSVAPLLGQLGFSLQSNRKTREGSQHPDRDAQFVYINQAVAAAFAAGQPVISVDTKKKELVGDFKAVGRELAPKGRPVEVRVHDFKDKELGKAIPYGVYDLALDTGFVSVGIDNDTSQFSVASIRAWWEQLGQNLYPDAKTLTITADCGGSNGNRTNSGRPSCNNSQTRQASPSASATSRPRPASGTRSSTSSSASSARTGAASPSSPTRSSSTSSPRPQPAPASRSTHASTPTLPQRNQNHRRRLAAVNLQATRSTPNGTTPSYPQSATLIKS